MAVTLLRTDHLGGTAFELYFQIDHTRIGVNNGVDGQLFDIHGLAQMKFFIQYPNVNKFNNHNSYDDDDYHDYHTNDNKLNLVLSVMKHEFTMKVNVEIKLICKKPQFKFNLPCSETWSEHKTLFNLSSKTKVQFNVEVNINVGSCKPVLDIMYMDEDFTDFQMSTTEGSVPVHRVCLAAHSDVFKRMLCGEWKETDVGRIELQGVTLKTLQNLKRYMYLGTLPEEGLYSLLLIASYYLIDDLKVECTIKVAHSITSENLYDALEFSYASNIPELTFAILKTVRAQPTDVIGAAQQRMVKPKQKSEDNTEKMQELVLKPNE